MKLFDIPIFGEYFKGIEIPDKTLIEYQNKQDAVVQARQETFRSLELFGRTKSEVLNRTIIPVNATLSFIEDIDLIDQTISIDSLSKENEDQNLITTILSGGESASMLAVTFAAVGKNITSLSTISSMTNAMTMNATVGFLTGANLSTSSSGILGGLLDISSLILGNKSFDNRRQEKIRLVNEDIKKINNFINEANNAIEELENIKRTSIQLNDILMPIESLLTPKIKTLNEIINKAKKKYVLKRIVNTTKKRIANVMASIGMDAPDALLTESKIRTSDLSKTDKRKVVKIIELSQILKSILDINIINDEGIVPKETIKFIKSMKSFLKSTK